MKYVINFLCVQLTDNKVITTFNANNINVLGFTRLTPQTAYLSSTANIPNGTEIRIGYNIVVIKKYYSTFPKHTGIEKRGGRGSGGRGSGSGGRDRGSGSFARRNSPYTR